MKKEIVGYESQPRRTKRDEPECQWISIFSRPQVERERDELVFVSEQVCLCVERERDGE